MIIKFKIEDTEEEKGYKKENPLLVEGKVFHIFPQLKGGLGISNKYQAPTNKQFPIFKIQNFKQNLFGHGCLKFIWDLEFVIWCLFFFFF
jgi:hypothetical protein